MIFGFGKKKNKPIVEQDNAAQNLPLEVDNVVADNLNENKCIAVEQAEHVVNNQDSPIQEELSQDTVITIENKVAENLSEDQIEEQVESQIEEQNNEQSEKNEEKTGYFSRLKQGLAKTGAGISSVFLGKKQINDDLLEELETALLIADVGVDATREIIDDITNAISRKQINDQQAVIAQLKTSIKKILASSEKPLIIDSNAKPFVILMVGINGAGKTTTIGKLTQRYIREGKSVMLAAGDTFRAAAVEQLKTWADRSDVAIVSQESGSDSASVIYDAYQSAVAKNIDILIADTAGRLHTQTNLMKEIEKIVRIIKKANPAAPHEIMLVVDAGNGQNALNQAKEFNNSLSLTGITITKLDGTAKGGIIIAIAKQQGLPVRFIGVGEKAEDLRVFNADEFIDALLSGISKS